MLQKLREVNTLCILALYYLTALVPSSKPTYTCHLDFGSIFRSSFWPCKRIQTGAPNSRRFDTLLCMNHPLKGVMFPKLEVNDLFQTYTTWRGLIPQVSGSYIQRGHSGMVSKGPLCVF
jgi:hypothetical protein